MCQLFQACRLCFNITGIRFSSFPSLPNGPGCSPLASIIRALDRDLPQHNRQLAFPPLLFREPSKLGHLRTVIKANLEGVSSLWTQRYFSAPSVDTRETGGLAMGAGGKFVRP